MLIQSLIINIKTERLDWIEDIYDSFQPNHLQEILILDREKTAYIFFVSVIEKNTAESVEKLLSQQLGNDNFTISECKINPPHYILFLT